MWPVGLDLKMRKQPLRLWQPFCRYDNSVISVCFCEGGRVDRGIWRADICNSERSRARGTTFQAKRSTSVVQVISKRGAPAKVLNLISIVTLGLCLDRRFAEGFIEKRTMAKPKNKLIFFNFLFFFSSVSNSANPQSKHSLGLFLYCALVR